MKPWYQCETPDCHYVKSGNRARFCKSCAKKIHKETQEKSVIVRIKLRFKARGAGDVSN